MIIFNFEPEWLSGSETFISRYHRSPLKTDVHGHFPNFLVTRQHESLFDSFLTFLYEVHYSLLFLLIFVKPYVWCECVEVRVDIMTKVYIMFVVLLVI